MFKKTKIAIATAAMLGSVAAIPVAEAVAVNPDGTGQVLIYPYYNTNAGFQTNFSFRNTKDEFKAVKVRLRESENSNDVLDFNVYMSPFDVFTFAVKGTASGPVLVTSDKTCTYPAVPATPVPLKGDVYKETTVDDAREGYVEVIEMGVIDRTIDLDPVGGAAAVNISAGLDHGTTGVPADCSVITKALNEAKWTRGGAKSAPAAYHGGNASPAGFLTPTGGLQGSSILLDVANGAAFVADPVALVNYAFDDAGVATGAQYYLPDDANFFLFPSLASGNVMTSEVIGDAGITMPTANWPLVIDDWGVRDPSAVLTNDTPGRASGLNPFPVSHALAATAINNSYFIDPGFDAATDWVVTFPMRKHGIFNNYTYDGGPVVANTHPVLNFVESAAKEDVKYVSSNAFWDREEQQPQAVSTSGFSPVVGAASTDVILEREVNILTFAPAEGDAKAVLGSGFADPFTMEAGFISGWARLNLSGTYNLTTANARWATWTGTPVGPDDVKFSGVPTLGFAAIRGNTGIEGKDVGETVPHSFTRVRGN
ncbi:MAG: hypothetical protein L3J59_01050 [Methylococcaceae bacterium]|nr:hypothetical protein [Methylococcaceae bacterium]